ncbi:MAG TPA: cyclopropane-fatty-acyl-phospholipid synthase family protein [Usitatibacteraceae bacterium]|nr:cyclopropane-fatty-acyl-phospholipid synthase family protein [Usitatibacteraceae bacterium]
MNTSELTARPGEFKQPAVARLFYSVMSRLEVGQLSFTAPDGTTTLFRGRQDGPHADLRFADWEVAAEAFKSAEIGLAEAYKTHRLSTSDLTHFLMLCIANEAALSGVFYGKPLVALFFRIKHMLRMNTRRNARRNIQAHYDLSNDFYRLWLDESMTYSAALFADDADRESGDLAAAQAAKYQRILDELDPAPGDTILEIGCGWGGFAEYAAKARDVRITGITLSAAQLDYARRRIARAGLADRVDLQLIDYRDIDGRFDHIVSIEMFEAVGERYWPVYFRTLRARLKPGGRALVQTITIADAIFPRYRATSDFIREYIFPGGMLPPVSRFVAEATKAGLAAGTPLMFGLDYAATLRRWREQVDREASVIRTLGFDEAFLQLWRFYLCYCEAGFRSGRTDVMQIALDAVEPA